MSATGNAPTATAMAPAAYTQFALSTKLCYTATEPASGRLREDRDGDRQAREGEGGRGVGRAPQPAAIGL